MRRVRRNGIAGGRGAAILAAVLFAAGAAQAEMLVCEATSGNAPDAASHVARVSDPFGEAPELTGAAAPLPVRLFRRERTLIFDGLSETLYFDSENHSFSYIRYAREGIIIWRGKCRTEE